MQFDQGEREYLLEMRYLTQDVDGREVFTGLSVEESVEYFGLTRPGATDHQPGEELGAARVRGDRYLELHWKMKAAQIEMVAAEHVLRTAAPTRN